MIDVLIQTYNEELNLPHTLASVKGWARNVFVVDSGSTDRTVAIAEEAGARVVHHGWEGYARQKNWALATLPFEAEWVLIVDADEAVSAELRDELLSIARLPAADVAEAGFLVNRVLMFFGRPIRHCGYFPSWNLRFFKRGRAKYEDRLVHEHMIVDGPTGELRHLLVHEDRRGMEHYFAKHNRYSTLEAVEIWQNPEPWPGLREFFSNRVARRRFGKSRVLPYLPLSWLWRFLYMYVVRFGFLDGRAGWRLCCFIAAYELFVQLKFQELKMLGGRLPLATGARALAQTEGEVETRQLTRLTTSPPEAVNGDAGALPTNGEPTTAARAIPTLIWNDVRDNKPDAATTTGPAKFVSPWTLRQNIGRALWMVASATLFRPSFHNWYGWRRFLLRAFGAKIGANVRVRPSAKIEIPWNLEAGDSSVIGDYAIVYSLGKIKLGRLVIVSQFAHLCAGTHDHRYRDFPLLKPPITIGDEAWIAADAFVGPGVTVGARAVVGARASAFKDVPPDTIAVGNPARPIRRREFLDDGGTVGVAGDAEVPATQS